MSETNTDGTDKRFDLIVVGGGAAGLMAAGTAAHSGKSVLLIEKMEKTARKVNITGKGRCNLTNMCEAEEFLSKLRTGADFFAPSLRFFSVSATCHFFRKQGVKLEVEQGRRVFPKSGKAYEISDALRYWCKDNDVVVMLDTKVEGILTAGGRVYGVSYTNKRGFRRKAEGDNVLITTGGASYPGTGSTGDGYAMARAVGHTIVPVRPSLVALVSSHPAMGELAGLRLKNVKAELVVNGRVEADEFGEMEFSRRGLDGPVILRLSRAAVDALSDGKRVEILLDLKPPLSPEILRGRFARETEQLPPRSTLGELLRKMLPRPLVGIVVKQAGLDPKRFLEKINENDILKLINAMKCIAFPITGHGPFEEAIVTAGGVDTAEVDPETLRSKLIKGLYFAGEVLDLDADTGGYNLQVAFSTGRLAAQLK